MPQRLAQLVQPHLHESRQNRIRPSNFGVYWSEINVYSSQKRNLSKINTHENGRDWYV